MCPVVLRNRKAALQLPLQEPGCCLFYDVQDPATRCGGIPRKGNQITQELTIKSSNNIVDCSRRIRLVGEDLSQVHGIMCSINLGLCVQIACGKKSLMRFKGQLM